MSYIRSCAKRTTGICRSREKHWHAVLFRGARIESVHGPATVYPHFRYFRYFGLISERGYSTVLVAFGTEKA